MTINDIMRLIQPIKIKLWTVVGRAKLLAVDNSGKVQRLRIQFTEEEVIEKIERLQDYGLESNPPIEDSSEVAYQSVGGQRGLTYIIKVQARALRPAGLSAGEVVLWSKHGQKIHLKSDGSVDISAPGKVSVTAPTVELSNGTLRKLIDERIKTAWADIHVHPYTDNGSPMVTGVPTVPLDLSATATEKTKAG